MLDVGERPKCTEKIPDIRFLEARNDCFESIDDSLPPLNENLIEVFDGFTEALDSSLNPVLETVGTEGDIADGSRHSFIELTTDGGEGFFEISNETLQRSRKYLCLEIRDKGSKIAERGHRSMIDSIDVKPDGGLDIFEGILKEFKRGIVESCDNISDIAEGEPRSVIELINSGDEGSVKTCDIFLYGSESDVIQMSGSNSEIADVVHHTFIESIDSGCEGSFEISECTSKGYRSVVVEICDNTSDNVEGVYHGL